MQVHSEAEELRLARERKGPDDPVKVGDYVFLRRPPVVRSGEGPVSRRLQPRADFRLYIVKKVVSNSSCVLADPDTGSTELGFSQPVAITRLIPYNLCLLDTPIDAESLRLEVMSRNGTARPATVTGQTATGKVELVYDSPADSAPIIVDLSTLEYRWIS